MVIFPIDILHITFLPTLDKTILKNLAISKRSSLLRPMKNSFISLAPDSWGLVLE
jgi:hypothetical protein